MTILYTILLVTIFCATPALVIWLCRRYPTINKLGPIMILYAIGMVLGNMPILPPQTAQIQEIMPNVLIPLAIPMMLFGCTFTRKQAGLQLKIVLSGFCSVAIAIIIGYLLFGNKLDQGAQIGGIITGMYTGGTLNAAALQAIFKIKSETYVLINSYDIVISFMYFVFLFTIGIRLFRKMYGQSERTLSQKDKQEIEKQIEQNNLNPYLALFTKAGIKQLGKILCVTIGVAAIAGGIALILPSEWFMIVFMLMLTTLGVACSFNKKVRALNLSYDIGMYLIYIFSMVIASMADFSDLNLRDGLNQLAFMLVAVFLSLLLHAIACRILRVDADSMVISSVAFINSPPFVPMAAAAMRNKDIIVTGLSAGIIGYAAGNHLGVLMVKLLSSL